MVDNQILRPDVKALHNVYNAGRSGFDVKVPINLSAIKAGDKLAVMSRWTSDRWGNNDATDLYGNYYTIDYGTNKGWLDSHNITSDGQLHVSGWNATNQSLGKPYRYLILWDNNLGHEVERIAVQNVTRHDVGNAYPQILNADDSGFAGDFNTKNLDLNHSFRLISRYSNAANGEGQHVDYWFPSFNFDNAGWLDSTNADANGLHIAGWNATDASIARGNHFLILFDRTNGRQLASIKVTNGQRQDVIKAYPNIQHDAALNSGFNVTFKPVDFDGTNVLNTNDNLALVSRYSDSATGNGGSGHYTDYWFDLKGKLNNIQPVTTDWIDDLSQNAKTGIVHVKGWMLSNAKLSQPNTYVFLMDARTGKELARQKVDLVASPDIVKAYPHAYDAAHSRFDINFDLSQAKELQNGDPIYVLLRFTANPNGDPDHNASTDIVDHRSQITYQPVKAEQPTKPDDGKQTPSKPDDGKQQPSKPTDGKGQTDKPANSGKDTNKGTDKPANPSKGDNQGKTDQPATPSKDENKGKAGNNDQPAPPAKDDKQTPAK